jgi:hypothetical protein
MQPLTKLTHMSLSVKYVNPTELKTIWPWVREKLLLVQRKSPEQWMPEEIYCQCFNQNAMLWVGYLFNKPACMFILEPLGDTVGISVAWSESEPVADEALKHIEGIAKKGDARYLEFRTWRRGWEKRARQMGFRPRAWVKEI